MPPPVVPFDDEGIAAALAALRAGAVVVLPTDTVYGVAVDATAPGATDRLFAAKRRPRSTPLAVLVASVAAAAEVAEGFFGPPSARPAQDPVGSESSEDSENLSSCQPVMTGTGDGRESPGQNGSSPTDSVQDSVPRVLAERFWPGPLTMVLPRRPGWPGDLGDETRTVGVRRPDHDLLCRLLAETGPLATTSANLHGRDTPPDAAGVAAHLGAAVALILDGGPCAGAPSTVVDCTAPDGAVRLLREGRLPWTEIIQVLGGGRRVPPGDGDGGAASGAVELR